MIASFRANIAGFLLALACAVQIPWCLISVYRGRLLWVEHPDRALVCLLLTVCGIALIQWAARVYWK